MQFTLMWQLGGSFRIISAEASQKMVSVEIYHSASIRTFSGYNNIRKDEFQELQDAVL